MLLEKLENYYRKEGILSTEFQCKYLGKCKDECESFTEAKSAYVGARYGEIKPRLLFVSSDPGSTQKENSKIDFSDPKCRTPAAVQEGQTERAYEQWKGAIKTSPRFREANKMALHILQKFAKLNKESVLPHYAHTNSAKCCANREGNKEAPDILFQNCRTYLRGEINVFAPDVIVTVGKPAKEGVEYSFRVSGDWWCEQVVALNENKKALWLPSYHPSNYGAYYSKCRYEKWGKNWEKFADRVARFMDGK